MSFLDQSVNATSQLNAKKFVFAHNLLSSTRNVFVHSMSVLVCLLKSKQAV